MNISDESKNIFKESMKAALPDLFEILQKQESSIFLLGSGVFELYASNGWCSELSRQTTDLDFSFEIVVDHTDYQASCAELLKKGYKLDDIHPYRYLSPSRLGPYIYVDLLTFTVIKERESMARGLMGAGESFSFKGMEFAKQFPLKLEDKILVPNPLAFIYLKMIAYRENPDRRLKDFVDVFELVVGFVLKRSILDSLKQIAIDAGGDPVISEIKKMIKAVSEDSSPTWDYEVVENQILLRSSLENLDHQALKEFFRIFLQEVFE